MREEFTRRGANEWDLLTLEWIPEADRKGEAQLYETKWFDYRRLHPMAATFELISCYLAAHRGEYARRFDVFEAKALDLNAMEEGKIKLIEFWQARRLIDSLGIRYDFYCNTAGDMAERCWKHLARPEDLTNSFLVEKCQLAWEEMRKVCVMYPTNSFFQAGAWVGHPDQRAWQRYVAAMLKARGSPQAVIDWQLNQGVKSFIMRSEAIGSA